MKVKRILFILLILIGFFLFSKIITDKPINNNESKITDKNETNNILEINSKFYNGNDIIRKYSIYKDCEFTISCIEISNAKSDWLGTTNKDYPIALSRHNLLKLRFKNTNEDAGISLISKYSNSNDQWWKGKANLDISANANDLSIILHTGMTEEPLLLFNQKLKSDISGQLSILVLFDELGKNFTFTDSAGSFIKKINLKRESKNLFRDGLFNNRSLYFGYFIAPFSQLTVSEFYLMPYQSL